MGWGRGRKGALRVHRFYERQVPPRCALTGCTGEPTHWCPNVVRTGFTCDRHKSLSCCRPFKVVVENTPLQKLGSWVFTNDNKIDGAPEDLLLDAFRHVEIRMVNCAHGNARARATERWLGRWARLIDGELTRQQRCTAEAQHELRLQVASGSCVTPELAHDLLQGEYMKTTVYIELGDTEFELDVEYAPGEPPGRDDAGSGPEVYLGPVVRYSNGIEWVDKTLAEFTAEYAAMRDLSLKDAERCLDDQVAELCANKLSDEYESRWDYGCLE